MQRCDSQSSHLSLALSASSGGWAPSLYPLDRGGDLGRHPSPVSAAGTHLKPQSPRCSGVNRGCAFQSLYLLHLVSVRPLQHPSCFRDTIETQTYVLSEGNIRCHHDCWLVHHSHNSGSHLVSTWSPHSGACLHPALSYQHPGWTARQLSTWTLTSQAHIRPCASLPRAPCPVLVWDLGFRLSGEDHGGRCPPSLLYLVRDETKRVSFTSKMMLSSQGQGSACVTFWDLFRC